MPMVLELNQNLRGHAELVLTECWYEENSCLPRLVMVRSEPWIGTDGNATQPQNYDLCHCHDTPRTKGYRREGDRKFGERERYLQQPGLSGLGSHFEATELWPLIILTNISAGFKLAALSCKTKLRRSDNLCWRLAHVYSTRGAQV